MFKQITVFLENKPGRMVEVTGCLADNNINLHALSIADTTDFGILRMIVSDPGKALEVLKEKGFMVKTAGVIAAAIGHQPGSLNKVLRELKKLEISIEYMYAFTSRHRDYDAIVILSLSDQDAALEKLKNSGFPLLEDQLLDQLNEL
ncbi:MAG: ACT domain-containing protein [Oscillospiraceae bacterium]|nr:ACT domain-containing protein [Oscillospiraceae bacterium]